MVRSTRGSSLEKRLRTILGGKPSKDILRFGAELEYLISRGLEQEQIESPEHYSSEDPVGHQGKGFY